MYKVYCVNSFVNSILNYNQANFLQPKAIFLASAIALSSGLSLSGCGISESDLGGKSEDLNLNQPIFFVKRPVEASITADPRTNTILNPGGDLYMMLPGQAPVNLTSNCTRAVENVKGAGDVSAPNVNIQGNRVVFAMHLGALDDADADPQNTWDIWEYFYEPEQGPGPNDVLCDSTSPNLRRVISGNLIAAAGNDLDPVYLPDGRIVFTSDRQDSARATQISYGFFNEPYEDERGQEPALNLHVMGYVENQTSGVSVLEIKQISFNQSDDRYPSVLHTGEIVFSRWEGRGRDQFDLFKVRPDGSGMQLLYGAHSHDPAAGSQPVFYKAREMADGRLLAMLMDYSNFDPMEPDVLNVTTLGGGALVSIDYQGFADNNVRRVGSTALQAQGQALVSPPNVLSGRGLSLGGRFDSPFPIWETNASANRMLVAWSFCRVAEPIPPNNTENNYYSCSGRGNGQAAEPSYGLYVYNMSSGALIPAVFPEQGFSITDPVILMDRTLLDATSVAAVPTILEDKSVANGGLRQNLLDDLAGAIHVRSVYDTDTPALFGGSAISLASVADPENPAYATAPVRFVRLTAPIPRFDGVQGNPMHTILGYAPVQPDGSVFVQVPGKTPFAIDLLDSNGHKITEASHENWLQVIPGETIECHGCHEGHSQGLALNTGESYGDINSPQPGILAAAAVNFAPLMSLQVNETMATALSRLRAALLSTDPRIYGEDALNRDLVWQDFWTNTTIRAALPTIRFEYNDRDRTNGNDGLADSAPIYQSANTSGCLITDYADPTSQGQWDSNCRIIINYEDHLQPLWDVIPHGAANQTCITCHTTNTGMSGLDGTPLKQVPAGQLDLTQTGPLATDSDACGGNTPIALAERTLAAGDRYTSYSELLNGSVALEVILTPNSQLTNEPTGVRCVAIRDANGAIVLDGAGNTQYVSTGAGASIGGNLARNQRFLAVMTDPNLAANLTVNHTVLLTPGERRVVAEWIDLLRRYQNDPRLAPRN